MKKKNILTSTLWGSLLLFASSAMAQERVVKMTTAQAIGSQMTIQVNKNYKGITIDWGDGHPVVYKSDHKEFIDTIEGAVKGSNITISGEGDWYMLNCSNCGLTDIDLSNAQGLQSLYCQHNQLTTLDVKGMNMLTDLNCSHNQIAQFEFTDNSNPQKDFQHLESLNISHNEFSERYMWRLSNLQTLIANDNKFTHFYIYEPNISYIDCGNNQIKNFLVLTDSPKMSTLNCQGNGIIALKFANDGENLKQLVCDNNKIRSINIANAQELSDLSCSNNSIKELLISAKARDISSYNAKNNALGLHSLPGKGGEPMYLEFLPQNPFNISSVPGMLVKEEVPYAAVATNWNDREQTAIDLKDFCTLANNRFDATYQWFAVNPDGSETELTKRTSSSGTEDYCGSFGKFSFFTPHKKAYLQLTSKTYGFAVKSTPIAIGDDITAVENIITSQDGLQITAHGGSIMLNSPSPINVNIYTIAGKSIWNGMVNGTTTISLPKGVYVVNGKKVML